MTTLTNRFFRFSFQLGPRQRRQKLWCVLYATTHLGSVHIDAVEHISKYQQRCRILRDGESLNYFNFLCYLVDKREWGFILTNTLAKNAIINLSMQYVE